MRTSARNALPGVIQNVVEGAVNAEVTLRLTGGDEIVSVVTLQSARELGLALGTPATALIKSSFVILAPGSQKLRTSARNCLSGEVVHHVRGAVNDEVTVELDGGGAITATVTSESARDLGFEPGAAVQVLIKAPHVILMVE